MLCWLSLDLLSAPRYFSSASRCTWKPLHPSSQLWDLTTLGFLSNNSEMLQEAPSDEIHCADVRLLRGVLVRLLRGVLVSVLGGAQARLPGGVLVSVPRGLLLSVPGGLLVSIPGGFLVSIHEHLRGSVPTGLLLSIPGGWLWSKHRCFRVSVHWRFTSQLTRRQSDKHIQKCTCMHPCMCTGSHPCRSSGKHILRCIRRSKRRCNCMHPCMCTGSHPCRSSGKQILRCIRRSKRRCNCQRYRRYTWEHTQRLIWDVLRSRHCSIHFWKQGVYDWAKLGAESQTGWKCAICCNWELTSDNTSEPLQIAFQSVHYCVLVT